MPDYTHLLEIKLTTDQKLALNSVTEIARAHQMPVFLTGGAVRDIVSGSSVRDLDVSVQGNALKLRKDLERAGFTLIGEHGPSQSLFVLFHAHTRLEIASTHSEHFAKAGRVEYQPAGILDDLRRRDFTANAMALSLNKGSYGLMLDPLNGTADILAQHLRLVDNYGFLDAPIRMVRATRLMARTGWGMEERTKVRYDYAKAEGAISHITAYQRGYELEEIAYEEDALVILKALEAEGWMEHLFPAWNHHCADAAGLQRLHENLVRLMMAGLHPDAAAATFLLLTAKMPAKDLGALKRLFPRHGLVQNIAALERDTKEFSRRLLSKDAAMPSQVWKLIHSAKPEAVLWLLFTGKNEAIQGQYEGFFNKWAEAQQQVPYAILQEMRIKPELENYAEVIEKLTFALMDAEVVSEGSIREFLAPYSPPAPAPATVVRRPRSVKRAVEPKQREKSAKALKASAEGTVARALASVAAEATAPVAVPETQTKMAPAKMSEIQPAAGLKVKPSTAVKPIAAVKPDSEATAKKTAAAKLPARMTVKSAAGPVEKKAALSTKKAQADRPVQRPAAKAAPRPAIKAVVKPVVKPEKNAAVGPSARPVAKSAAIPAEKPSRKKSTAGARETTATKPVPAKPAARPAIANKKPVVKKTAAQKTPRPAQAKTVAQPEKKSVRPAKK